MKKDVKEIATKSEKELSEILSKKREELFGLMMDLKQNKLKNTRSIFNTRKEIARTLTLIREKQLLASSSGAEVAKGEAK